MSCNSSCHTSSLKIGNEVTGAAISLQKGKQDDDFRFKSRRNSVTPSPRHPVTPSPRYPITPLPRYPVTSLPRHLVKKYKT